jgi:ATP-binding cassette, subfamily C (CFTR/MRP), member 1
VFKEQMDPVIAGGLFSQILTMGNDMIWGSQMLTELEASLVSYQRWLKMLEIPQEAPDYIENSIGDDWPKTGNIQFNNFSLRYRPETELVLKNLTFSIKNKEKIGVIGRTGAGKSTLWLALWRIIEANGGSISIDGVDIASMGLEQLRTHITVIPQDPTLFTGTLRFNLDPEGIHSDEELRELTSQAALDKLIDRDEKGLDQQIEENGQNLSSGEKQLLWIWRAILRCNKIVLMDEATANIDIKTEQTIQQLILEKFKEATVLTIAHRLNTIMHSDRVLVMQKGEVAEFDSPQNLLDRPESIFKDYVNSFRK